VKAGSQTDFTVSKSIIKLREGLNFMLNGVQKLGCFIDKSLKK